MEPFGGRHFFIFAFPWLVTGLKSRGPLLLLAASFGLGFIIILLATVLWPSHANYFSTFNPVCRIFEFILGMATCKFWLEGKEKAAGRGRWLRREIVAIIVSLVFVVGIPVVILETKMANAITSWVGSEICALVFAALIWVFAHQSGPISRSLSKPYLVWLGEISFAVYMCHQIILRRLVTAEMMTTADILRNLALVVVLTMVAAAAIFHLVETPARHAIVSGYKRWSKRPANK